MLDAKFFDEIAKKISDVLPPGVQELQGDLEQQFKAALQSSFTKLNLVSREEFDVQSEVLARTRAKLEQLEAKVAELEARLNQQ